MKARIENVTQRIADAIRAEAPELRVRIEGDDVIVEGRALASDPRLRWIVGLVR